MSRSVTVIGSRAMSFTKDFTDPVTGAQRRAHVSHFITNDGKLVAICNTKAELSEAAALEARAELEAFVRFLELLQQRADASGLALMFGEDLMEVSSIDPSSVQLVTYGPLGGRTVGFDQELDVTEEDLTKIAQQLIDEHQPDEPG
jgi:hypothetical protein